VIREDPNAMFWQPRRGASRGWPHTNWRRRYYFRGTKCPPDHRLDFTKSDVSIIMAPSSLPVSIVSCGNRTWWLFEGTFYWTDEGHDARDMLALIRDRERRAGRKLERAHTLLKLDSNPEPRRQPIPKEVRRAVFERDGGKCVECGGNFDIQFDHIIPFALGGATSVENLQLLCSSCNLEKSDSL
jgi:hypothetical protein